MENENLLLFLSINVFVFRRYMILFSANTNCNWIVNFTFCHFGVMEIVFWLTTKHDIFWFFIKLKCESYEVGAWPKVIHLWVLVSPCEYHKFQTYCEICLICNSVISCVISELLWVLNMRSKVLWFGEPPHQKYTCIIILIHSCDEIQNSTF